MKALALVAAFLSLGGVTEAATVARSDGGDVTWYEAQVERAHVPSPSGTIALTVGPHACPIDVACTYPGDPPRIAYDAEAARPDARRIWFNEVGHVFDFTMLRTGDRSYFQRVLGDAGRPWDDRTPDSPAEKFGDAYWWCARNARSIQPDGDFRFYDPTQDQHRRICRMIRRAGGWR